MGRRPPVIHAVKSSYLPVKVWLEQLPPVPLIIAGDSGSGKTFILETLADDIGIDLVSEDSPIDSISGSRHPSFSGMDRVAVIDHFDYISKKEWAKIEDNMTGAKVVMVGCDLSRLPYSILKMSQVVKLHKPAPRFLASGLRDLSRHLGSQIDEEAILEIADKADSWRQAFYSMQWSIQLDNKNRTLLADRDQPKAILSGGYSHSTCHPLSVLSMANHNGVDIIDCLVKYSNAWNIDGLSEVSRLLIEGLRAETTDKPPYVKRNLSI